MKEIKKKKQIEKVLKKIALKNKKKQERQKLKKITKDQSKKKSISSKVIEKAPKKDAKK